MVNEPCGIVSGTIPEISCVLALTTLNKNTNRINSVFFIKKCLAANLSVWQQSTITKRKEIEMGKKKNRPVGFSTGLYQPKPNFTIEIRNTDFTLLILY